MLKNLLNQESIDFNHVKAQLMHMCLFPFIPVLIYEPSLSSSDYFQTKDLINKHYESCVSLIL